jgi:autophagy-related protein 2
LYEGYDFERSRKFIKDTVKATRKKLEKIRQLLAEGQVPDETVEEAAESLLQSVFLPPSKASGAEGDDLDTFERIAAFDDELDRDDVTTYSWETVQQRSNMRRTFSNGSAKQTGQRLRRLRRPKTSALDINLTGLTSTLNLYGDGSALASRISLEIHELGIVDHLRTSSWNKFLTELRPRDGGILRPTASPMVKVQLSMVKNVEAPKQQEANLKIKVCPLRLHIDQDALDFLKAFAAFKMDTTVSAVASIQGASASAASEAKDNGGFVQRVEIFPIKIKLDYKPKRVDYQALRQGRTIELMNFFSFEASEMVLRHLVLNGVPSWAKVGDLLQDIWTPDVKANQLADFHAGINPVRSVVNVGSGVADLVLLPVQQYKKDGRLVRGVQRGSKSFAKTTALEAIKLGARMATGTQVILEHAERVLGGRPPQGGSPVTTPSHQELFLEDMEEEDELTPDTTENLSRFSKQPTDVREGIQTAYKSLSGNMRTAAETILAVPMEVYEHSDEVSFLICIIAKMLITVSGSRKSGRQGCPYRCVTAYDWRIGSCFKDATRSAQHTGSWC